MFQIKICGITSRQDVQLTMLAGADALGLNFYSASKRCLDTAKVESILPFIPARIAKVGIFVNRPADEVREFAERFRLDMIQLHGQETPEQIAELEPFPVVKAFPFSHRRLEEIQQYLAACQSLHPPAAVLVDADDEEELGGTGQTVDWSCLAENRELFGKVPLVLAGGLTPFNVAEAIATVRPDAVDTASGVESEPGTKNPMLVRAFVNEAKRAFAKLG